MASLTDRLEELHLERRAARRRAAAYAAAAVPVLAGSVVGVLSLRAAVVADLAALAAALWWFGIGRHALARRRRVLDDLILHRCATVAPDAVRDRERELLSPRNRKLLARALERQVAASSTFAHQRRPVLRELRAQRGRVGRVVHRLRSETVDPRGVVMLAKLLTDGASPIHQGPTEAIAPALERLERALDRAA